MKSPSPIRIQVDSSNPGQFFACCGLLELADRRGNGAAAWFDRDQFCIATHGTLADLVRDVSRCELVQLDPENNTSSPIRVGPPFRELRLDWWQDTRAGGKDLKVWAGTMESVRIAKAMQNAMRSDEFLTPRLFDVGLIAYDPENPQKKVEPYYFDARRAPNAHSRDVGFSPNDLSMTTTAFPAVELLCLIGLQRCLPAPTKRPRIFDYFTWTVPVPTNLVQAVVAGQVPTPGRQRYRFENWYRTGQKKHKAFRNAIPLAEETL